MTAMLLYLPLGMISGLLAGMLGVGGGIILVPALFWLFGQVEKSADLNMHLALATSLASIIPTALAAIRSQQRRGAIDWALFRQYAPGMLLGSFLSAYIAGWVPGAVLKLLFALFLAVAATQMLVNWQPAAHRKLPGIFGRSFASTMIGMLSALVGIGGGTLTVPYLHWFSVDMRQAVATSSALGLPIALFGAIGFVSAGWGLSGLPAGSFGYVQVPAMLTISLVSVFFAPLGVRLGHHLPTIQLKRIFGALLLLLSLRMLWPA